jgi:hypothetical protein
MSSAVGVEPSVDGRIDLDGDSRAWSSSVVMGLAFAGLTLFYSFYLFGVIKHAHVWAYSTTDIWLVVDGGRFVWHGALGYIYQGTQSYSLPLSFIVMAPVSGLIDHYGLVEGSPFPIAHPSAWLLVGPYSLVFGIFLLHGVRRLAWDLGVRRRLWAVQLAAVLLVLVPCFQWGHFEDVVALTFVLHAVRKVLVGDFVRAALLISVAVSFKQTAGMLIPWLVFMAPRGLRLRCLGAACALPAAFVALTLGVDWNDASKALFSPVNMVKHYPGHSAIYLTWLGKKTSQVSRTIGLLSSVGAGWFLRKVRSAPQTVAAIGLLLIIRPFSEAIIYSYYWSPGLLFAGLVGLAVHKRFRIHDWLWPVLAIAWASPRSDGHLSLWWWTGEIILIGLTAFQTAMNLRRRDEAPPLSRLSVKNVYQEPILMTMTTAPATGDKSWIR